MTSRTVLVALDEHYPSLAGAMLCTIKASGLTVGKTLCKIEKLLTPSKGGVIQCTLTGFFSDPEGVRLVNEKMAAFGMVLIRRVQHIGKTKHISGVYDFVLALKDPSNLPLSSIILERDGVSERIPLRITGGLRHCVFRRSATHVRKDCTVAPLCKICSQQTHATQHCPRRHAAGSQGSQPLRASPAAPGVAAVPAAASATPATPASDRKRRRTDNAPLPPPEVQTDNGRRKPTSFNFTFTSLPGPRQPSRKTPSLLNSPPSVAQLGWRLSLPKPRPGHPHDHQNPSCSSYFARADAPGHACLAPDPTMPTEKPETTNHPPRTANRKRWIKMMTSTKIPNVSFVAANVQSINEVRKRACLFSNFRSHNADVFLLSETGRPTPERVAQWTQECRDLKLSALFTPLDNTAILWKSDSPVVTIDPESPSNFLRASFAFPARISDATFRVVPPARFQVPGAIDIGPGKFEYGLHVIEGDATCEYLSSTVQTLYNEALLQTPDDPKAAWTTTKHRLLPQLQALARTLARFRRGGSEQERADHSRYGAALRSRIDLSLAGPSSIFIRLRKVRASDLIPSLAVNDVLLSDPDSMLGAASDYFESVYQDRPIDDAALEEIIDGLASTRFSPADSHKLERAYPLEEMSKAQESCKSNSSPGPDGLPVEFYRATWTVTGPILRDVINSIPTEGLRPEPSPRNIAHIHLIHKTGERDQLVNKHPISLINADERIISQAHNQRLAPLLEFL
ncbi:BQ2448_6294 [Microbotryum intermedium]|uniref:BQ2448_6294 protein n=1 Tax=Microbotryum intermedium TaxID=269621 RepID=A0A238FPP9_9BASI|nr:BQ2448_6294 [Microbotryum intermedium]